MMKTSVWCKVLKKMAVPYPLWPSWRCFISTRSRFLRVKVASRRRWRLWETFQRVMRPSWFETWPSASMGRSAARLRTRLMSMGTLERFSYESLLQVSPSSWREAFKNIISTLSTLVLLIITNHHLFQLLSLRLLFSPWPSGVLCCWWSSFWPSACSYAGVEKGKGWSKKDSEENEKTLWCGEGWSIANGAEERKWKTVSRWRKSMC